MVLVHADAIVAAQFPAVHPAMADDERLDLLIGAIEAAIGTDGTLVIPAFSYSFTKGEVFERPSYAQRGGHGERAIPHPAGCLPERPTRYSVLPAEGG